MALIHAPEVLFLDEPTTGLDPTSRATLWDEVRRLRDEGTDGLPDHAVPRGGRPARRPRRDHRPRPDRRRGHARGAEGRGRPAAPGHHAGRRRSADVDARRSARGRAVRRRCAPRRRACTCRCASRDGAAAIAPVVRALDEAGFAVEGIELVRPTLDDVFAEKTGHRLEGDARGAGGRGGGLSAVERDRRAVAGRSRRRTLRNALRRPQFLAPLVLMPTLFLAINTGGLHRSTDLPGFPHVDGFLDFQLAGAITQSLLLGGVMQGIGTALEIEGGFFDRLVASPIPRVSIVLGRILAGTAIAAAQVVWFLVLGAVFGVSIHGGVPGALLVVLIGALAGTGFAALGVLIALRAATPRRSRGSSRWSSSCCSSRSAFFPRALLAQPADWFADYNPLELRRRRDARPDHLGHRGDARARRPGRGGRRWCAVFAALAVLALRGRLREAHERARWPSSRALVRRALNEITRVPGAALPGVLAPSIFLVGLSGVFGEAARLPGFDATDFRTFIVPVGLLQGAAFTGAATGVNLARDIERGWFDRLMVCPAPRVTILVGRRGQRGAARAAARDVPADRGVRARRRLPGRRRAGARRGAGDGPGDGDRALRRARRAEVQDPAGGAADADRRLHGRAVHHRLRADGRCWPAGCARSRRSTRSRRCSRASGRASSRTSRGPTRGRRCWPSPGSSCAFGGARRAVAARAWAT